MKIYSSLNVDFGNVVFSCNEMGILNIDLNNLNLHNNFDEDDPDAIIFITFDFLRTLVPKYIFENI